ncbi:MAG: trigger factor [Chloroflexi bacterium]|nr:trigger factor [Chloroflexota bacterium]
MKVTTERTPNCSAIVTVEVDEDQVQSAMKQAASRVSKIRPIPGFRPGKAPYERVERAIGKDVLRDEAIDHLAQDVYKQVLKDENIEPYDAGKLEVAQKEPLVFKFTVPTRPVVTLGDYRSIHMQPNAVEVTDEEINRVIDQAREQQATIAPVTRPVQMGDLVTINLNGGLEGQPTVNREGLEVRMQAQGGTFPWLDQLVGGNAGETRTINYTYPAAEGEEKGKTANYTVTIVDVKETQLPELNDDFVKSVSSLETIDQLRTSVRFNIQAEKLSQEDSRFADQVVDAAMEQSQIAYPELMVEDETDSEIARSKDLAQRLGLTWDKYLQLASKTEEQYRAESRPIAEKRLKRLLTLMQLVEAENIEATEKEIDMEIDYRAQEAARRGERIDQARRRLASAESRRDLAFSLKINKAINFLVASAKGEPTSGKILTPEMVRQEELARQQAQNAAKSAAPSPTGLITDPSQVTSENWPRGLDHPLIPGQEKQ